MGTRPDSMGWRAGALAGLVALSACSPGPDPTTSPPARQSHRPRALPRVEDLELKALLLLQVDRQLFEPYSVERAFEGSPELRHYLASSLGRTGSRRAAQVLQALLLDDDPAVRRRAAFGLGILGDADSRQLLLRVAGGEDPALGEAAVGALARLGTPVLDVGEVLADLPEEALWQRLLPSLHRFRGEAVQPLALRALNRPLPEGLRPWAVYALSVHATAQARETLRSLVLEETGASRAHAARALGSVAVAADLPYLRPLLDDGDPGAVLAVLQTVPDRLAAGVAAAPEDWKEPLLRLLDDPRPDLRRTALEAAGRWLLDPDLGNRLAQVAEAGEEPFASAAVLSLVRGRDPRSLELIARHAASPSTAARVKAVQGAAILGLWELIFELADDARGEVRAQALRTLLRRPEAGRNGAPVGAEALLLKAAQDPDAGVRADLLEYLVEDPRVPVEELARLFVESRFDRVTQSRVNGVKAMVARARAVPAERALAIGVLERLTSDREYLVRVQVALGLRELDAEAVPIGPAHSGRTAEAYQGVLLRAAGPKRVLLETARGAITLELDCPEVPLTCTNFLQLAEQGFYDGLSFHRVEPGFIAQGGDPRGDGWGGPGYTVRDELGPAPFEKGSLGMARPGPHGGGSQFFLALDRLPGLDGAYTHMGRVIDGLEVLDTLVEGDEIASIQVLP